jgi:hypothetical protein
VGGKNDDALARKLREKIAVSHPLFGVEACGGFIDNQELQIVEQCLRNAHTLAHAARKSTQGPIPDVA